MSNLMLHCGAESVTRNDVMSMPAPVPMTNTHYPISHSELVDQVERAFQRFGKYDIVSEQYGISHEGSRFFAVMSLRSDNGNERKNWETIVGLRNAHKQEFSAGAACGSRVFVCDNLAFSGDISFGRKHTKYIREELPGKIDETLYKLSDKMNLLAGRYDHYESTDVDDKWFHDVLCRSLDVNRDGRQYVVRTTSIPKVLKAWREPVYQEFEPRTAWSAFNAFTEATKGIQINEQSKRTQTLHTLFDEATGAFEALLPQAETVN